MTHIVEYRVEGLAGRTRSVSGELDRNTNIFFGVNGSGKTSLLKIFHAALSNSTQPLQTVPFRSAYVKIYSVDFDREFEYSITKSDIKDNKRRRINARLADLNAQIDTEWKITPEMPSGVHFWQHRFLPISRNSIHPHSYLYDDGEHDMIELRKYSSEERTNRMFVASLSQTWVQYNSVILNHINSLQSSMISQVVQASILGHKERLIEDMDDDSAYKILRGFLTRQGASNIINAKNLRERIRMEPTLKSIAKDIEKSERMIQKSLEPQRRLQEFVGELFSNGKHIELEEFALKFMDRENNEIPLEHASSGEKQLIRILMENMAGLQSSVIIDEPEISMHIDWQVRLVEMMRLLNSESQIILATHSPEVMANIEDKFIHEI